MRIVIATNNSRLGRYFAYSLNQGTVLLEYGRPSWRFIWKKFRKVGLINFVFQYFFNAWFKWRAGRGVPDRQVEHIKVGSVNVYPFQPDDLVICFGTSYITKKTLAKATFLNLHTGVLPQYRGVKSEWWALKNRDWFYIGWTLHKMMPKLDAGEIIFSGQRPEIPFTAPELRSCLVRAAVDRIRSRWDRLAESGTPQDESQAHYYTTPTLWEWLGFGSQIKSEAHSSPPQAFQPKRGVGHGSPKKPL